MPHGRAAETFAEGEGGVGAGGGRAASQKTPLASTALITFATYIFTNN